MNVYLLTNLLSSSRALVFARMEHEARYRRPDGAVWRLGRWYEPGGRRIASPLDWWPGTPDDIEVDPVLRDIDADSKALERSPVMATKSLRFAPEPEPTWSPLPQPITRRPSSPEPMAEPMAEPVVERTKEPSGRAWAATPQPMGARRSSSSSHVVADAPTRPYQPDPAV